MVKKVIIRIVIIITIVLASVTGYYLIIDRESNIPNNISNIVETKTEHFMGRRVFKLTPKNKQLQNKNELSNNFQEDNFQEESIQPNNSQQLQNLSNKVILYFHGGSYTAEMTDNHWKFLANLANDTNMTVIAPDYPLTPKATYENVFNMIEPLYKKVITEYGAENVIVIGDSAGGGMALGLIEKISINDIKQPAKTILISPWLDISMSNPKIDKVDDRKLNKNALFIAGMAYSRGMDAEEEYLVSPVKGKVNNLKNVTIFIGNKDMLSPDCYSLQEKARQVGVDIEIKEYENADHIWIIDNDDELAKRGYKDLINILIN
ncbi:MAG: alpha/beta hydrolase [Clostridia bacterium]|nr:alpha/beta hydrolase [Clostridia bacterium]